MSKMSGSSAAARLRHAALATRHMLEMEKFRLVINGNSYRFQDAYNVVQYYIYLLMNSGCPIGDANENINTNYSYYMHNQ